jgi:hypothetical protein
LTDLEDAENIDEVMQPPTDLEPPSPFHRVTLPNGETRQVPSDITISVPRQKDVSVARRHLLAYVPWDEQYLMLIPEEYRAFFSFVRPHLSVRTTNVHTAISISYLPELMASLGEPASPRVMYLATILHDCGWSMLSPGDIADSLDYEGIAYTQPAAEAKFKHTLYGSSLAYKLLEHYFPQRQLALGEKMLIADIVRYHQHPAQYRATEPMPLELVLTCEADRLWPFTRENFWLDTIRKGVQPHEYLETITAEIDSILLTDAGRGIARRLVAERQSELEHSPFHLAHA